MKGMYKVILFFAMFYMSVIVVNSLGVFPNTFYSDAEVADLRGQNGPMGIISYLFALPDIPGVSALFSTFTFAMLTTLFLVIGAAIARATQSWTPVLVVIITSSFVPMLSKSWGFFRKLFTNWDVESMTYLALALGVGLFIIVVITIMETPSHGRSGT